MHVLLGSYHFWHAIPTSHLTKTVKQSMYTCYM